jgi:transketolase
MMGFQLGPRRGRYIDVVEAMRDQAPPLAPQELEHFESFDLIYRSLCGMLYNYVPMSGHPGGSISSGRFVAGILFDAMDYDVSRPDREDADLVSYAAGHKALGLYAMWALRNEVMRIGRPVLLPVDEAHQLRLEDLLGFRRNPITRTPLFLEMRAKALDGHPTPATPFLRLSTGASGVGDASSIGLAWGAKDYYGAHAPRVHIVEGEGGMTPGRVAEVLAAAGTACLDNVVLHVDWNQSSIDSNRVCRDGDKPGDYVQWNPIELLMLHDWNVLYVPDGKDFQQVLAAQRMAAGLETTQPTAIVYRTVKGWKYGIEGRASHGGGHPLCSDAFYAALDPLLGGQDVTLPSCKGLTSLRCSGADGSGVMEDCFWDALEIMRGQIENRRPMAEFLAGRLAAARDRLDQRARKPRDKAPRIEAVYETAAREGHAVPEALKLKPGAVTTLRNELGRVINYCNAASGGAVFVAAADLLGSTSVNKIADGFPPGYWNAATNPESRTLSIGGICEDGISGICSGLSSYGRHIGVGASYAAFIAPLGHIAARLHAIGNQARVLVSGGHYLPMILVCAHAGLTTGEDGPTHADPQALQVLQENFPPGTSITLTPWDPAEIWTLMSTALARRPSLIAPFVTRPNVTVLDRAALGLAPVSAARTGVYRLRTPKEHGDVVVVLQECGVTMEFIAQALPRLEKDGIDVDAYYVASSELFTALPLEQQEGILSEALTKEAMGITGFTMVTMCRWVRSYRGRAATLFPYRHGHFLGSGQASMVLAEAGLDGESQYRAIRRYLDTKSRPGWGSPR